MNPKIALEEILDYKNLLRLKLFRLKLAVIEGKMDPTKARKKIAQLKEKLLTSD